MEGLTAGMSDTMLSAMLRITKYSFFFFKLLFFFYFYFFIKPAYQYATVDEPVLVRVPQFEKP